MARFRLAGPARSDIAAILRTSGERWGVEARDRYRALLAAAFRRIAAEPNGPGTTDRKELRSGIRSFHIRHVRHQTANPVGHPVHVVFFRMQQPDLIEIIRVLHERSDPARHME